MTWIIHQTFFHQNVEIENSPNFNDVKVSRYTVNINQLLRYFIYYHSKENSFLLS